jgi:hypothetical protein
MRRRPLLRNMTAFSCAGAAIPVAAAASDTILTLVGHVRGGHLDASLETIGLVFPWPWRPDLDKPLLYPRPIWQRRRIEVG